MGHANEQRSPVGAHPCATAACAVTAPTPRRVEDDQHGIDVIDAPPCDILISPLPDQSHFLERVAQRDRGVQPDPVIHTGACRGYAADGRAKLAARLAKRRAGLTNAGKASP